MKEHRRLLIASILLFTAVCSVRSQNLERVLLKGGGISENDETTDENENENNAIEKPNNPSESLPETENEGRLQGVKRNSIEENPTEIHPTTANNSTHRGQRKYIGRNPADRESVEKRNGIPDPLWNPTTRQKLSLKRTVPYLGVTVDAGSYFFPLEWLRNLIDLLEAMGYNMLQLRLTDDRSFNVRLESQPDLANPVFNETQVYTKKDLTELVAYAKDKGVLIVPEIGVPSRVLGWAGKIPNIVVTCPGFICHKSHGIPLNWTNPKTINVLKDVIEEVNDIFSTSPFLHLGGDKIDVSIGCFHEAKGSMPDFQDFERQLGAILLKLQIPESRIIRWEASSYQRYAKNMQRTVGVTHFWASRVTSNPENTTMFLSKGLSLQEMNKARAFSIYQRAKNMVEVNPAGIVVNGHSLNTESWMDLNLPGKLLAVAIAAADGKIVDEEKFRNRFFRSCQKLNLPNRMCHFVTRPFLDQALVVKERVERTNAATAEQCDRLTVKSSKHTVYRRSWARKAVYLQSTEDFWNQFGEDQDYGAIMKNQERSKKPGSAVGFGGVVIDLVDLLSVSGDPVECLKTIIRDLSELGLNWLQLRVMSDFGFTIEFSDTSPLVVGDFDPLLSDDLRDIARYARVKGVFIIPEIALATRAGGWFGISTVIPCAGVICKNGVGVVGNTSSPELLTTVLSVTKRLFDIFEPPYVHLGYDERREAITCEKEEGVVVDFGLFEDKVQALFEMQGYPMDRIIRWENQEGVLYSRRAGKIIQYQYKIPGKDAGPSILSTGLNFGLTQTSPDSTAISEHVQSLVRLDPLAVVAPVTVSEEKFWQRKALKKELVALAWGLSIDNTTDQNELLSSVGFAEALPVDKVSHATLRQQQIRAACLERTNTKDTVYPKVGALV